MFVAPVYKAMEGTSVKLHTYDRYICGKSAEVEGNVFKFLGASRSVGVVKILEPVSPMLNYFEIQIVDKGRDTAIGLGLGHYQYPLDRMPGWNNNSIGYHADDGRLFHQNGFGKAFGPLCTTGDRMGCGIDFDTDVGYEYVNVFFTKNGKQVGSHTKVKRPIYGFYPLIGLHSPNEKIQYLGHSRVLPDTISEPMITNVSPSVYWLRANGVKFIDDCLTLEYFGDGLSRQDVGIAQGLEPLTPSNHYFELKILDSGKEGWIAIGLGKSTYPLTKHPGWNAGSVGYHADNGHLYKEKGNGDPFGPTCTTGDVMGCGIKFQKGFSNVDFFSLLQEEQGGLVSEVAYDAMCGMEEGDEYDDEEERYEDFFDGDFIGGLQRSMSLGHGSKPKKTSTDHNTLDCCVYFTKNGEVVGETKCTIPAGGFYPLVALLSSGEKIKVDLNPLTG